MRALDGLGKRPHRIEIEELSMELARLVAPAAPQCLHTLLHGPIALSPGNVRAVVGQLFGVPASPHTHQQPAA